MYHYTKVAAPDGGEHFRRRVAAHVDVLLRWYVPHIVLRTWPRASRRQARARLVFGLVDLLRHPAQRHRSVLLEWLLCHGGTALMGRLLRAAASHPGGDWRWDLLRQSGPDRVLPGEHLVPEFQSVQRTGSPASALICFTGSTGRLNMPVQLFHCAVVGRFDALIYLRDPAKLLYTRGIAGLADSIPELGEWLRARLPPGCRLAVLGTSGGGIAAAHTAQALGARRLVLCSPPFEHRGVCALPATGFDKVGRARLFLAAHNDLDRQLASLWRSAHRAPRIEHLDTDSHGTLAHLAREGRLAGLIDWLAMGSAPALRPRSRLPGTGVQRTAHRPVAHRESRRDQSSAS